MDCGCKRALQRQQFHYVSFFQAFESIQEFAFFLPSKVQILHDVSDGHVCLPKVFVPLVQMSNDGFFQFSASPCCVAHQNNDCFHEGFLLGFSLWQISQLSPIDVG
jgi:hypothetical protein